MLYIKYNLFRYKVKYKNIEINMFLYYNSHHGFHEQCLK